MPGTDRRIFISYRRSDTQGYAGWLHQILAEHYGRSRVFRDLDSIQPGEHFPTRVARTIAGCTHVFVLIGPAWLAPGPDGRPRLADSDDWVRLELETALQRGLQIVPLLIGDADLPPSNVMPVSLRSIADHQAFALRDAQFTDDVRQVLTRVDQTTDTDRRYLGTVQQAREQRFAALIAIFAERIEKDGKPMPWSRVEHFRAQFDALIDVLEPDEEVADLSLGTVSTDDQWEGGAWAVLKTMKDTTLYGLVALTPRRVVYTPRLKPSSTSVVWFRDVIEVRTSLITGVTLVLANQNVGMGLRTGRRAKDFAAYIRDRMKRR
jgi:hypothetical protein